MTLKKIALFLTILFLVNFTILFGQSSEDIKQMKAEMQKLSFLIGHFKTNSTFQANGESYSGDLRYEYVLGDYWIKFSFVGVRPGTLWESYGMITWDRTTKTYVSHVFYTLGNPAKFTGFWLDENTVRFELITEKGASCIDYINLGEGKVQQKNWQRASEGDYNLAMVTTYERLEN